MGVDVRTTRPGEARQRRAPGPRAFTLVELVATMLILATISAIAIPSLGSMQRTRERAMARELERRLVAARATAMATGQPCAVRIDAGAGVVETLRIATTGAAPQRALSPTGDAASELVLAGAFPGVAVTGFVNGDGASALDAIWFDHAGAPHLRDGAGALVGAFTTDAVVTVTGGHTVTVRRLTGLIER